MKKITIGVESFEEMRERKLARAHLLSQGVRIKPESRIMFDQPEDLLRCLTPLRLRLIEASRKRELSVSDLAACVNRDRAAVQRDLKVLCEHGLVKMTKRTNPGHGQVQMVKATASKFMVMAAV